MLIILVSNIDRRAAIHMNTFKVSPYIYVHIWQKPTTCMYKLEQRRRKCILSARVSGKKNLPMQRWSPSPTTRKSLAYRAQLYAAEVRVNELVFLPPSPGGRRCADPITNYQLRGGRGGRKSRRGFPARVLWYIKGINLSATHELTRLSCVFIYVYVCTFEMCCTAAKAAVYRYGMEGRDISYNL